MQGRGQGGPVRLRFIDNTLRKPLVWCVSRHRCMSWCFC